MKVDGSLFQTLMPEKQLDCAQVGACFEHVCGEAMPQSVRAEAFVDAGAKRRLVTRIPDGLVRNWLLFGGILPMAGEQIYTWLDFAEAPVMAQSVEEFLS